MSEVVGGAPRKFRELRLFFDYHPLGRFVLAVVLALTAVIWLPLLLIVVLVGTAAQGWSDQMQDWRNARGNPR